MSRQSIVRLAGDDNELLSEDNVFVKAKDIRSRPDEGGIPDQLVEEFQSA